MQRHSTVAVIPDDDLRENAVKPRRTSTEQSESRSSVEVTCEDVKQEMAKSIKKGNTIKFLTQALFAVLVFILSCVMITKHPDEPNQIWIGLICTVTGIFFPHPNPN